MRTSAKSVGNFQRAVVFVALCGALVMVMVTGASAQEFGGRAGAHIKILALNVSTSDTPFCGVGAPPDVRQKLGGMVGDRLAVDAFMDEKGVVTGSAVFRNAQGKVTVLKLDSLFPYFGGLLLQEQSSGNVIPIWLCDQQACAMPSAAAVTVEFPRGCENTLSTFTPGVDLITTEITITGLPLSR